MDAAIVVWIYIYISWWHPASKNLLRLEAGYPALRCHNSNNQQVTRTHHTRQKQRRHRTATHQNTHTHTRHTHSTTNDNSLVAVVRVVVAHKIVVGGFADGGFAERRPIGRRGVASPNLRPVWIDPCIRQQGDGHRPCRLRR